MVGLKTFAVEFLAVTAHIMRVYPDHAAEGTLYIKPDELQLMLDRNPFLPAEDKLTVWRDLQWIRCEGNRFTKRIKRGGITTRCVVITLSVYEQLRRFYPPKQG